MTEAIMAKADWRPKADSLVDWLIDAGCQGTPSELMLQSYCERLVDLGCSIHRMHVTLSALHPIYGGLGFVWRRHAPATNEAYKHREEPTDRWVLSPFYMMIRDARLEYHASLETREDRAAFPIFEELHAEGATDYFAITRSFEPGVEAIRPDPNDPGEGVIISWTSEAIGGFEEWETDLIRASVPALSLALKSESSRRTCVDVMATYIGDDAAARVLSGEIVRGSCARIDTLMWDFDLRGFTALSEQHGGEVIVEMLNEYFDEVVRLIAGYGGNVLKFMGDGLMASFDLSEGGALGRAAVDAAAELPSVVAAVTASRRERNLPIAGYGLALNAGEALYGNIGGESRLDFTVIGPAVNETARIQAMCKSLERPVLLSENVAREFAGHRDDVFSLGRYMLRGVKEPRELFTFYSG
ncbi:MAG: adenylate/guanylate cyclase domain-containing protein [Pseudomonadota bacterium]